MGNCQAAEASTVVIQRPGGTIQRIYWSVSANEVMASNPGHYVAALVTMPPVSETGTPVKQLKLLRPDDTLRIGHVYRLISFEEVLKEFAGKKYTKLSKLISMQNQKVNRGDTRKKREGERSRPSQQEQPSVKVVSQVMEQEEDEVFRVGRTRVGHGQRHHQRQWRPALQSISEIGM
ncbi:uncharacterized protein LOC131229353 [Magnolia sinica]|uniref:uncharacterized protein LOC131229353 n=1 Tax=Magnolia sinica TaxID=86752 RepID=UPI00265A1F0C|nr:uncharacterized protein LOC131229353 [Magnolia sinica]